MMVVIIILLTIIAIGVLLQSEKGNEILASGIWLGFWTGIILLVILGIFVIYLLLQGFYLKVVQSEIIDNKTAGVVVVIAIIFISTYFKRSGEEKKQKDEIKPLFSEKQIDMLDGTMLNVGWKNNKDTIMEEVKFFESILEGGVDPRNLKLYYQFQYIKPELLEKAKKELLGNTKNFTPEIIMNIRKKTQDTSLDYALIRQKIGLAPVIGKKTHDRIKDVLKETTNFDDDKIEDLVVFVMENIKK